MSYRFLYRLPRNGWSLLGKLSPSTVPANREISILVPFFFNWLNGKNENFLSSFLWLRDGSRHQIGWIFGKVPKGGIQKCLLQSVSFFIFLKTVVEKNIPWALKLRYESSTLILYKELSSPIFPLWVSEWGMCDTLPDLHFVQYIKA